MGKDHGDWRKTKRGDKHLIEVSDPTTHTLRCTEAMADSSSATLDSWKTDRERGKRKRETKRAISHERIGKKGKKNWITFPNWFLGT
uniref:Uncharacterized protein n=1 Tax=Nelumbo nucifera TaxID=4432 RepID=A0A822ZBE4_NELNU|nr:TPA_asm: hypothetical protein HUJ06_014679 [Nelumbo nucifera]